MGLFSRRRKREEKRQAKAAEKARLEQEQRLQEAEAKAEFAVTEGKGIAFGNTIDLSFDDDEDYELENGMPAGWGLYL